MRTVSEPEQAAKDNSVVDAAVTAPSVEAAGIEGP
jgi:hypothetical protein